MASAFNVLSASLTPKRVAFTLPPHMATDTIAPTNQQAPIPMFRIEKIELLDLRDWPKLCKIYIVRPDPANPTQKNAVQPFDSKVLLLHRGTIDHWRLKFPNLQYDDPLSKLNLNDPPTPAVWNYAVLILNRITNKAELIHKQHRTQDLLPVLWQEMRNNKDQALTRSLEVAIQVENEAEGIVEDDEDDEGSDYAP